MMTLGIDTGVASFGLALANERGCIVEYFSIVLDPSAFAGDTTAVNTQRLQIHTSELGKWLARCERAFVERLSTGMNSRSAALQNAMSFGTVVALCRYSGVPLRYARPEQWKRDATGDYKSKKLDDAALYLAVSNHVKWSGLPLPAITEKTKHGLDAAALAVVGALHWDAYAIDTGTRKPRRKKRK
jgi:Holliday junction resolvasome RuvABC endonuclease subunit